MAEEDPQLATKAPESDLHAKHTHGTPNQPADPPPPSTSSAAPVPETVRAQSGPSMGDHCTSDRPTPTALGTPAGEIVDLNGVQTYIAKPTAYPAQPSKLLLLLTGGTGLHSTNNQLQADAFAARGYVVIMPDQFNGDAAPNTSAVSPAAAEAAASNTADAAGWLERFKLGAAETAKAFLIDMWLARHTPEKVLPVLQAALAGAREQFADAVANGGGVYGAGYCFGAKYTLLLLGGRAADPATAAASAPAQKDEEAPAVAEPELKAGAIAHGTLVTAEDVARVRAPVGMVCVAGDSLFPDAVREQGKAALELGGVEHDVSVWEGVPHGFAVVGDYAEAEIVEKQRLAFEAMVGWLEKF